MKDLIEKLVRDALAALPAELRPLDITQSATLIERTRDPSHGDFATNAAMQLAKAAKRKPRELAQAIIDALPANELVAKLEIAGPGFINFFLAPAAYHRELLRGRHGKRKYQDLIGIMMRLKNVIYWKGKLLWRQKTAKSNLELGILLLFPLGYLVYGILRNQSGSITTSVSSME